MKYAPRFLHVVVAAAAGILLACVFPPLNFPWPLAIGAFIVWVQLLRRCENLKQTILIGFGFGFGFFVTLLQWIKIVGTDAWIALTILCTFWWVVASVAAKLSMSTRWWPIAIPAIWTSAELLRDRYPFGGFGWGQIGVITPMTPFANGAALVGQLGMTFAFVATATFILWIFSNSRSVQRKTTYLSGSVVLVSLFGFTPAVTDFFEPAVGNAQVTLGIVQGGVDHYGLGVVGDPRTVLSHHADATVSNSSQLLNADLIVWPENAADVDPTLDMQSAEIINDVQKTLPKPILLGAIRNVSDSTRANVSLLWENEKWTQVYQKRRLVPFGEFLPARSLISQFTDRVNLMPRDFEPGTTPGFVEINGVSMAVLICFEAADDWQALAASEDSSVIIIQTNNATYQFSGESEQQLQSAQMRALETRRPVVVVSTSGLSAVTDPHGRVTDSISQTEIGALVRTFPEVAGTTPAVFMHHLIIAFVLMLSTVLTAAGIHNRRKVAS
ncbi:MAG: apolipoprotein N-acyltransferase [Actinomycetota bacterium]